MLIMENKKQIKTEKQKQKHYEILHAKNEMLRHTKGNRKHIQLFIL